LPANEGINMIMKNKTILITGGATGIGLATAKLLNVEGAKIIVTMSAVDTGGRVTLQRVKRRPQHLMVDMVQERREFFLLPSPRGEPYALQRL
jgi:short-subunit dehydrogenase involved in D-alanine esterification of teichoic acids